MVLGVEFLGGRLIHSLERGEVKVYFFPRKDSNKGISFGEVIGRLKLKSGSVIFKDNGNCCLMKKKSFGSLVKKKISLSLEIISLKDIGEV